ncbi:hypothetical protein ACFVUW_10985 [Streptomyces xiamenensis]|uniref:hypothetical protein n=1 Tax=Streptomyces xiamenensis TaxID=408015 RepID=UPI0036E5286D
MKLVMLAVLGVLTVVMAVFAPYVYRTEPTGQAIAWTVMLIGSVVALIMLSRVEVLLRRRARTANDETPHA